MEPLIDYLKFEIVDLPGMNTIGFVVEEGEQDKLSLSKIDAIETNEEGRMKKTFNVIPLENNPKSIIVLLTLTNGKAIISTGELSKDGFEKIESNVPLNYGTIYNTEGVEYKEVNYSSDLKRNFCIIDTQTGVEVKPNMFVDPVTNEMKSNIKILPHRTYIVLELKKK